VAGIDVRPPGSRSARATTARLPARFRNRDPDRRTREPATVRPTSPWKASSPTWWRNEPDHHHADAAGAARTQACLLLIPLPLILIGLTLVGHLVHPDATDWQHPIIIGLGFAVIVPIVSLIVGSSVIGSEIDDGTIVHIMTKPIPRSEIVLSKLAVAAGVTGLVNGAMLFVCGWIITGPRLAIGLGRGAVASICYSALFVALSLVSRRPC